MAVETKTYKTGNSEYRLKELTLGVMHQAVPLFKKYRNLHFELTGGIDTAELECVQRQAKELELALEQLNSEDAPDADQTARLSAKLGEIRAALNTDPKLKSVQKYYSDMEALAMYSLITDKGLLGNVLPEILETAAGKPVTKNDAAAILETAESLSFVKDAVTDFFSLTLGIMKK